MLVGHQVGDGTRRQHRLVPPRGQVDAAFGPAQPDGQAGVQGGRVDVREVVGGHGHVRGPAAVGGLGVQFHVSGRLVVPQPQPGRGAEVGGDHLVVREAEQLAARGARPGERLAERGRETGEHLGGGDGGRLGETRVRGPAPDQRLRVLGRGGLARGLLGGQDERPDLLGGDRGARDHAGRGALRAVDRGDDREPPPAGHAVGGQRVGRPAQIGGRLLVGDHHGAVRPGQLQCALDGLVGRAGAAGGHRPDSWVVLRMVMSRNRAEGQPCDTAAVCPGCAFPHMNEPPMT